MVQEGFEHIYKVLEELRRATCRSHIANSQVYGVDVDKELWEFRKWLDAPPEGTNGQD